MTKWGPLRKIGGRGQRVVVVEQVWTNRESLAPRIGTVSIADPVRHVDTAPMRDVVDLLKVRHWVATGEAKSIRNGQG